MSRRALQLLVWVAAAALLAGCERGGVGSVDGSREPVATASPAVPVEPAVGLARVWSGEELTPAVVGECIEYLDTAAREHGGLERAEARWLLGKLGAGKPAGLDEPAWQHFFNSACNALGAAGGVGADALCPVLLRVLSEDSDKVMRLYALQHLGNQQPLASEPLRSMIGRRVLELAGTGDEQVAGTALDMLERWGGQLGAEVDPLSNEVRARLAVATMLDRRRATDVRSCALHMAVDGGFEEALPAARTIAANAEEDVLLRKASIHLIGQLGVAADRALLDRCTAENPRLAQATGPALEALSRRLAGVSGPKLIPYESSP